MTKKELILSTVRTAAINYQDRLLALREEQNHLEFRYGPNDEVVKDLGEQVKHYTLCLDEARKALEVLA